MAIPTLAVVESINSLAYLASKKPSINPATPTYAILMSDTQIPLTVPSSWGEFSPQYEAQTSDYPVEEGQFALYNKVRRPQIVWVGLTKTGSDGARFAWLAAIRQLEASRPNQLYTLISPQEVFIDFALAEIRYETRPEQGSNILRLSLRFVEVPSIRSSVGNFPNVLEPKSGPVQSIGRLFTRAATAVQTAATRPYTFLGN